MYISYGASEQCFFYCQDEYLLYATGAV